MINKALSCELLAYFERCIAFYENFLQLETNKYQDVLNNLLSAIDGYVKEEQVYMLKAKGFEAERIRLLQQTQMPEASFRELIPLLDDSVREEAMEHFESLSEILLKMKDVNQRCNELTELKLKQIQNYLDTLEAENVQPQIYTNQAQKKAGSYHMVSKKV